MSPSIWMQCGGPSRVSPLQLKPWRVVEAQYVTSTRKLVDSDAEQALLESLIDGVKPPLPQGKEFGQLHYLLFTPFRHPPLRHGSRFGTRLERGIFYAAVELRTAFAEMAYYRLVFLEGTAADLGTLLVELTGFQSSVRAARGVDLTAPPFDSFKAKLSSPTRYDASQRLGKEMRAAGVEAFLYRSARDALGGVNLGLFAPAFAQRRPSAQMQSWVCTADKAKVELRRRNVFREERFVFPRAQFEVRGALPSAAL